MICECGKPECKFPFYTLCVGATASVISAILLIILAVRG